MHRWSIILFWSAWTPLAWADDCEKTVANLIRWSSVEVDETARNNQVQECRTAVQSGEQQAILSAQCLSKRRLKKAVACLTSAIQAPQISACEQTTEPDTCEADLAVQEELLREQLLGMIQSGQSMGQSPQEPPAVLPPPPTEPGSCQQMIANVEGWSGEPLSSVERSQALQACDSELQIVPETAIVVMCLSNPNLEIAIDCMINEAIRANMDQCQSVDPKEQQMCEQMLLNMRSELKDEFRQSILDGSMTR